MKTKEQVDLIAEKEGERWIIEAKGLTSAIGTDFNTCLGQLVKSMKDDNTIYAIAVPNQEKYKRQCGLISDYFRKLVGLHILLVAENEDINVVRPSDSSDYLSGFYHKND
ncbi:MAG: hypothetical protein K0S01_3251 [Herbinix sp.]|nr:hypothetical protein [Herbinix sp.]